MLTHITLRLLPITRHSHRGLTQAAAAAASHFTLPALVDTSSVIQKSELSYPNNHKGALTSFQENMRNTQGKQTVTLLGPGHCKFEDSAGHVKTTSSQYAELAAAIALSGKSPADVTVNVVDMHPDTPGVIAHSHFLYAPVKKTPFLQEPLIVSTNQFTSQNVIFDFTTPEGAHHRIPVREFDISPVIQTIHPNVYNLDITTLQPLPKSTQIVATNVLSPAITPYFNDSDFSHTLIKDLFKTVFNALEKDGIMYIESYSMFLLFKPLTQTGFSQYENIKRTATALTELGVNDEATRTICTAHLFETIVKASPEHYLKIATQSVEQALGFIFPDRQFSVKESIPGSYFHLEIKRID